MLSTTHINSITNTKAKQTSQPSKTLPLTSSLLLAISVMGATFTAASELTQNADLSSSDAAHTIVITSGRVEQPLDHVIAATSVITREEIETKQFRSVADALSSVPGVVIKNNGNLGSPTSVFIRGTNASHALVLVDGIRAGSATIGSFAFEQYNTDQIERIEVIRGAASSLYGADAVGGVIQIFTRRGNDGSGDDQDPFNQSSSQATLSLASGKYDSTEQNIYVNFNNRSTQINATLNRAKTDGFDALAGGDTDDDGTQITSGNISLQVHNGPDQSVRLSWLRNRLDNEFDVRFDNQDKSENQDESENQQEIVSAVFSQQLNEYWHTALTLGSSQDLSETFNTTRTNLSLFETKRDSAASVNAITLSDNATLTLGLDYLNDTIETNGTPFAVNSRDNTGVFANQRIQLGQHLFELSGRFDDNQQFDTKTTGSLKWAMAMNSSTRLSASHSTAFKAPTFNDLYFPGAGNANLRPESSTTTELGLQLQPNRLTQINSYLFQTDIDDLIVWMPSPTPTDPFRFQPFNVNQSKIRGWETSVTRSWLNGTTLSSHFTFLDARDDSAGPTNGNLLISRPRRVGSIDLSKKMANWLFGLELEGTSERFNDPLNNQRLPGYGLLNARAGFRPHRAIYFQAVLDNITDKIYQTNLGYNQHRRALLLKATFMLDLLK